MNCLIKDVYFFLVLKVSRTVVRIEKQIRSFVFLENLRFNNSVSRSTDLQFQSLKNNALAFFHAVGLPKKKTFIFWLHVP